MTESSPAELEVLISVCQRLERAGFEYMLTGSFALAFYTTPRMTRDLDFVLALVEPGIQDLVSAFEDAFYIDADDAREAVRSERRFNLLHLGSGIKVDFIVRKRSEYRLAEFGRRVRMTIAGADVWVVSREDLILSKLLWALDSGSELQRRDVKSLLVDIDEMYLATCTRRLRVDQMREVSG